MLDEETKIKSEQVEQFLAMAMCIDGEAKWTKKLDGTISADGEKLHGGLYKLTDSKRGTFYIAMLVPKKD